MDKNQWFLISADTVRVIRSILDDGMSEANTAPLAELFRTGIHELDSGLHKTEAVPDDFKVSGFELPTIDEIKEVAKGE